MGIDRGMEEGQGQGGEGTRKALAGVTVGTGVWLAVRNQQCCIDAG